MNDERFQKTELAVWVGIALHVALACLKGVVGFMAQSNALLADAAHSASDALSSADALIRLRTTKMPPEETYPYGQGKKVSTATILLSIVIMVVGAQMGISAIKSIWFDVEHAPKVYALVAIGISLFVKEIMFQYTYRLGKRLGSKELIANAWGHRSDIYSSIVALIGIFGSLMGNYLSLPFLYYLDPLAGLFVSLFVLRMGYLLVKEALHTKMDYVLQKEDAADLIAAVQAVKGVITVDDLRAREHGHYVVVDIKISVNPRVSVWEGHEVSKKVKQHLMKRFHHVSDVFVHVAPYDAGYPYKNNSDTELNEFPSVFH
ncbi:cation diffusion facilitator family transporter [Paenibacillus sp. yr247]|uniref:cation diffusion facilitator family transporter n=1 Tax=Paenibacillus sp. yr247 TaxID=1761880 RepID=UPI00088794C6|nr:cation diffusion facilitator family transporter [Paenibacillus sp. yr247]SDN55383.1 cation diffusion facilitator family transporter [Paenibacillus sp. yr247]